MEFYLRKAGWGDADLLFAWANDKDVRKNSFSERPFSCACHPGSVKKYWIGIRRCISFARESRKKGCCVWRIMGIVWKLVTVLQQENGGKAMGRN